MIYGQEVKPIDVSKGLWLADDVDAVPEGYAANLVNLHPDIAGNLQIRPNFTYVDNFWRTISFTLSNLSVVAPITSAFTIADFAGRSSYNHSAFELEPSTNTAGAHYVVFERESGAQNGYWISRDNVVSNFGVAVDLIPHQFAQYRNRYYAVEKSNGYSNTIAQYDFTPAWVYTRTVIVTLPAFVNSIVSFKDRLFASQAGSNRIYYTELASTGGYPENWNSGNNFFDLPDGGASIKRMFVANDRMYIFTTTGLYILYANGSPSNWQAQNAVPDIRIQSFYEVELIDGQFIFTDRRSVYIYNGSSSVVDIGQPIKAAMRFQVKDFAIPLESSVQSYTGPTCFKLFPYLDGFLIACYHYVYSGGSSLEIGKSTKYYYYAQEAWSEVQFDNDLSGANRGHYDLLLTMRRKPLRVNGTEGTRLIDGIVELRYNSNTTQVVFMAKGIRADNTNLNAQNVETKFGLFTRDTELAFPKFHRNFDLRVDLRTSISSLTLTPYVDGQACTSFIPTIATDGTHKFRVPVSRERGNSISLSLSGSLTNSTGPSGNQTQYTWPSFRLNRVATVVNTDTRNIPDQDYGS